MSEHPIKPWGHQVLVKMEEFNEMSEGGIVIPSEVVKKEQGGMYRGTIVAFGPQAFADYVPGDTPEERAEQWGCKIGDSFLSPRYPGQEFEEFKGYQLIPDNVLKGGIS